MKKPENIEKAFGPNVSFTDIKNLYVDTGDIKRLLDRLSKPQTLLVHGERGAGKSLLFITLRLELMKNLAEYHDNSLIADMAEKALPKIEAKKHRPIIPVFLKITLGKSALKDPQFDTVHNIVLEIVKSMLFLNQISKDRLFDDDILALASNLGELKERGSPL